MGYVVELAGGCLCTAVFVSVVCVCVCHKVGNRTRPRGSFSFGQTDCHHWIHVISCLVLPDGSWAGSKHILLAWVILCMCMCVRDRERESMWKHEWKLCVRVSLCVQAIYCLWRCVCVCAWLCVCVCITKIPSISLALNMLTSSMEGSNKFTAGDECRTALCNSNTWKQLCHLASLLRYVRLLG